jgi:hypothetical protein
MGFEVDQSTKLEKLKSHLETILAGHTNGGTWRVHEFVTRHLLGLQSAYDFREVMGDPVRWCRIVPVDQPESVENIDDTRDIGNTGVLLTHEYEVIIQYEFQESDVFAGSTQAEFNDLLWGRSPDGVLLSLSRVGGFTLAGTDAIIQVNAPDTIAIPSFPIVALDGTGDMDEGVLVHHVDFRIQLT